MKERKKEEKKKERIIILIERIISHTVEENERKKRKKNIISRSEKFHEVKSSHVITVYSMKYFRDNYNIVTIYVSCEYTRM